MSLVQERLGSGEMNSDILYLERSSKYKTFEVSSRKTYVLSRSRIF